MDTRRSFSFRTARATPAILFAFFAGMLLVVVVAPGAPLGVRAGFLLAALPLVFFAWRGARLALLVDDEGVVVRNELRSIQVPWDEVERIERHQWLGRRVPYEIGAVRRRGVEKPILVHGLTPPFGEGERLDDVVAELDALRRQEQGRRAAFLSG